MDIVRIIVHKSLVVIHQSLDKRIIQWILSLIEPTIHEKSLKPSMSDATRIACKYSPWRNAALAGSVGTEKAPKHTFWPLASFINRQIMELSALIKIHVRFVVTMAELKSGSIGKA